MTMVRYFVTYSGARLPIRLIDELCEADLRNRNTFVRGHFDGEGRLVLCEKVVYSHVELTHRYAYDEDGSLLRATIAAGEDDEIILVRDESGRLSPPSDGPSVS
jgi:hypothetical protein